MEDGLGLGMNGTVVRTTYVGGHLVEDGELEVCEWLVTYLEWSEVK